MKKFLLTLLCLVAAVGVGMAREITFDLSNPSSFGVTANSQTTVVEQFSLENITVTIDLKDATNDARIRFYKSGSNITFRVGKGGGEKGQTFTVSCPSNEYITNISFTGTSWGFSGLTNTSNHSWDGKSQSVTFTTTGAMILTKMVVTTEAAGPVDADVKFENLTVENGEDITPKYTAPEGLSFSYSSDNEYVVMADENEIVTMGVGTATITASWAATEEYNAGSTTFTVTVTEKDMRADAGLMFGDEDGTFAAVIGQDKEFPEFIYDTDAPITFTSSNPEVATIDENGAITLVGEGTTTITASSPANETYKAGEVSYVLTVTDPNKKGTEANPYTVAQALAAGEESGIYVKGYVVEIVKLSDGGQLRYYIADTKDGDKLNVYNGNYLNGDKFTTANQPEIGSFVVIYGNLSVFSGSNQLNAGNELKSITRPADAELAFAEAEYTVALGSDFTAPELSKKTNGAITWTSSKESVATVDAEGKVTLLAVGTTTITAAAEEVFGQFKAGEASYTLTVYSDALGTPECEEAVEGAISTYEGATLTFTAANAEKLTVNDTELTDGVYTVAFPENQNSYVLTVTAVKGEETLSADFTINRIIPGTVTFSAENGSTVIAGSAITLSCENADRIMWSYTEDGIFAEYTEEGITVDETNSTIFAYGEYKGFRGEIASAAYTMKEVEIYTLVTDVNELKAGGRYLIACKDYKTALGAQHATTYRDTVNVVFQNNDVIYKEAITTFRLIKSGEGWKLRFENGKYMAQSSGTTENETGDVYSIAIDSNGDAKIQNGTVSIKYNKDSPRFRTYASTNTNGMAPIQLYHLAETFEAPAEDAEVIYMHGVFADREWDFTAPVALSLTNDGTYMASNIHIGSLLEGGIPDLDFVFSTTMAEGGMPRVAGRRNMTSKEVSWADLGEGTVYHAAGVTKASAENAASEIVPFTAAKAGLYNITADFKNAWPVITLSESISTGVDNISVADGEVEYYNLQGIRVSDPKAGVYIRRQGATVSKVVLR